MSTSDTEKNKSTSAPEEDHVIKMWKPLRFRVGEHYNYSRSGVVGTLTYIVLRSVAHIILIIYNTAFLGVRVKGRKNLKALGKRGAVVVCNHVHPMDCTVIDCALASKRMYYATLESNFQIPFVRHIIRVFGGVPIPTSPHRLKEMTQEMKNLVGRGKCVCMYPEGVLVPYYKGLRRFRDGAFRLSAESGAPILPMVVTFRQTKGIRRLYRHRPSLELRILEPITASSDNLRESSARLREECFNRMEQAISEAV